MKGLNSLTDPKVAKKLNRKMILAVVAGGLSAYVLLLLLAVVANEIMK